MTQEYKYCISPNCEGKPKLSHHKSKFNIKGKLYRGKTVNYKCPVCGIEFSTTESDEYSLKQLKK